VEGEDLWAAVDPNRYPKKVGATYSIHVVEHKTHGQWAADPSLVDVTGAVETRTLMSGTLYNNYTVIWPNMSLPSAPHLWHKAYDIVFDYGNDGNYDQGDDILDRIGVLERSGAEETGGFTLLKDPGSAGDFPVSTHDYNLGSFTVVADSFDLIGTLYYPADGTRHLIIPNRPVNTDWSSYPLVIMAHGSNIPPQEDSYLGFGYLGRHLASRGFICASIALHELGEDPSANHRAVTILEHVRGLLSGPTEDLVLTNVRTRMDLERIGLLGHSLSGKAVVKEMFSEIKSTTDYSIKSVATLAPKGSNSGNRAPALPYLMIYGTRDGNLPWGYSFYYVDLASRPRHMITIYGANHNFFNQTWPDQDFLSETSPTITRAQQETLTTVFITAFFNNYLLGQQAYVELFSGYVVPPSVSAVGTTVLYSDQPERLTHLTIDDSQDIPVGEGTNSLGEANWSSGVSDFMEESLRHQIVGEEKHYVHDTDGLRVAWTSKGASITFGIGDRNVLPYDFLNFRVAQRFRESGNLNPANSSQDVVVTISDALGHSSPPVWARVFTRVLYPDDIGPFTKSIMQTVRLPLRAFTANGSVLDLRRLTKVTFTFPQSTGELIIDDIEFLGLDHSRPDNP
jgi:hypothetical protein